MLFCSNDVAGYRDGDLPAALFMLLGIQLLLVVAVLAISPLACRLWSSRSIRAWKGF